MIELGRYSYACNPQFRGNLNKVIVGNFSSIAEGCVFDCGFNHNIKNVTTFPLHKLDGKLPSNIRETLDITIQNDCWIGEDCMIMEGVTICNGAIVGAKTVVTKDIEPYEIVAGNKRWWRFPEDQRTKLLRIKWWDWNLDRIMANAELLLSEDINKFINEHI